MTAEEVAEVINGIRDKVRERYQKSHPDIADFELPSLDGLAAVRDRADAKVAAIGRVNPRRGGLVNSAIQKAKKTIARSLNWFIRDQVDFNRAVVSYMERNMETINEQNHNLMRIAREFAEFRSKSESRLDEAQSHLEGITSQLDADHHDLLANFQQWRGRFEEQLEKAEVDFAMAVRGLEWRAREQKEQTEKDWLRLHGEFLESLSQSTDEIQQRFWADLEELAQKHEEQIQTELRLIRRRQDAAPTAAPAAPVSAPAPAAFDYGRFEERFRGDEDYVAANQQFYLPYFRDRRLVADLGCGRGEFLELLSSAGVEGVGVDLDPSALAACREKNLNVEPQGILEYLAATEPGALDGILMAHVVEHLPPEALPRFFDLAYAALEPGGIIAIETPNPGCLAIFAGDFYVDPTHYKPVPSVQLDFHLRESGFGRIEVHERNPAVELIPELERLDEIDELRGFRERFFGGLDYAIIARKMGA